MFTPIGYDAVGRFAAISNFAISAFSAVNYSYLPNSDLISGLTVAGGSAPGLSVTRSYEENRNLLTQVKNELDSTLLSQYDYSNDAGSRRESVKNTGLAFETGPAFNLYEYNSRNEVVVGDRFWGADTNNTEAPVLGQSFAYAYDLIGNRTAASRDNEEMSYTANTLNQYTQRTVGDLIDVLGSAETGTTVTVNNQAVSRYEKYWHCGIGVTNSSAAVWQEINVVGVYNPPGTNEPDIVTSKTGHVFVAKTPETFTYDNDGNLLKDGRFNYTWDCENRLISAETLTNLPASVPRIRVDFEYDYMSRRISKTVGRQTGGGLWQLMGETSFLYDGWNVVSEICDDQSQMTTNFYVWGLDLSGSLQGAGGIGGLLAAQLGTNTVVYTYDGNGNVSELINTLDGTIAAHYEYSPFGEVLVATGELASQNPFQFSTKYFDSETGLNYYGYRYYSPNLGRFALSRDPMDYCQENFIVFILKPINYVYNEISSLYHYALNNPISYIDYLGLKPLIHPVPGDKCYSREEIRILCWEEDNINSWYDIFKKRKVRFCRMQCKCDCAMFQGASYYWKPVGGIFQKADCDDWRDP